MTEQKPPDPWYKKWWAIALFAYFGLIIIGSFNNDNEPTKPPNTPIQNNSLEEHNERLQQAINPKYKKLGVIELTYVRHEHHYLYLGEDKPLEENVRTMILKLVKTCPENKICDFMLWDSEYGYRNRDSRDNSSNIYSLANKEHLIGYRNTGNLFYYYGKDKGYFFEKQK